MRRGRTAGQVRERSAFAGFQFPPEVITLAVRWYLRYGLSYRDVEKLLAERGVAVDHVTVYRWVQLFTPLFAERRPLDVVTGNSTSTHAPSFLSPLRPSAPGLDGRSRPPAAAVCVLGGPPYGAAQGVWVPVPWSAIRRSARPSTR